MTYDKNIFLDFQRPCPDLKLFLLGLKSVETQDSPANPQTKIILRCYFPSGN